MSYRADPGGVFASDTHRRVLAHLPLAPNDPIDLQALGVRISADTFHELKHVDDLAAVLSDLEDDGLAVQSDDGWKGTEEGREALLADVPTPQTGPPQPVLLDGLEATGAGS